MTSQEREERAAKLVLIAIMNADLRNEQWRDRMIREGHKV
jgi:hypothetical protein